MTGNICSLFLVLFLLLTCFDIIAQDRSKKNSILLTGITVDADERRELPFVNIRIKNTFYGTSSDANGYFSIFINPGDTIVFSYVGYEDASFIMPHGLTSQQYSLVQLMTKDTMLLQEIVVFPWPDYNNFVKAFLDTEPPARADALITEVDQTIDKTLEITEQNRYYYDQQRYQRLFIMHEIFPPNNFLDPSRWANFIRDLRNDERDD